MTKYFLKRLLHGLVSIVIVVAIIMILIYSLMNRDQVFASDTVFTHMANNAREAYKYRKWEEYGYLDYVTYTEWLNSQSREGVIDETARTEAAQIANKPAADSDLVKQYVNQFTDYYESKGYTVVRLDAKMQGKTKKYANGGAPQLFAYKDVPLYQRMAKYFASIIQIDNIHKVEGDLNGKRGLSFTLYDPVYGGERFSPAIIGNGTKNKYLLYFDDSFPYLHQNLISINLGTSYTVNTGTDVFVTMTQTQGSYVKSSVTFPTGLTEMSADNLHTAVYQPDSLTGNTLNQERFTDNYTNVLTNKNGMSKMGYSFTIGIISTFISYFLGVPLGIIMARKKDKLVDKLGTLYIVFIIAVPSLAYIFLFKAIGGKVGLPTTFNMDSSSKLMYVLPIISLALPSIANLMKWIRRYMIDQMNSDYVKFARSGGLSESEIFSKHILKNAIIPIIHGIPGSILFAMTGAIITERVYVVPGAGNLLTEAINKYDNGVIVGVSLFYAILSVLAIILGDILMAFIDPRISFSSKAR